jgi:hypothetical protein
MSGTSPQAKRPSCDDPCNSSRLVRDLRLCASTASDASSEPARQIAFIGTLLVGFLAVGIAGNTGLFYGGGADQPISQAVLVAAVVAWVAVTSGILFFLIKKIISLRVAAEEEHMGLDVLEHGARGYNPEIYTADFALEADGQKVPVSAFDKTT